METDNIPRRFILAGGGIVAALLALRMISPTPDILGTDEIARQILTDYGIALTTDQTIALQELQLRGDVSATETITLPDGSSAVARFDSSRKRFTLTGADGIELHTA